MMRPGLHTRGVIRLARIKTNKQTNNTLQCYILTFPNTDIQDFGFSKHIWNSCTYSQTPLISDAGLWLFQTLELCTYSRVETPLNDHSKFEKLVAAYGKWLLMTVEQQGVVYKAFLEDLSFLGVLLRGDFGGGL